MEALYTEDALNFFNLNKNKAVKVILKNDQSGYLIRLKENTGKIGGFWSEEDKIITFWD